MLKNDIAASSQGEATTSPHEQRIHKARRQESAPAAFLLT
jgi:hypothetical protein